MSTHDEATLNTNYLTATKGWKSWAFTLDHKRIGVMYLVFVLAAFLAGGIFALLIRTELMSHGPTIVSGPTYNKLFTLHGAIMVFLFIIPSIPASLGNFVLPIQLGAKDVAFTPQASKAIAAATKNGYGNLPICIAKTQYSFSTDPKALGAPSGHTLHIREVRLAAGAEFVVMVCGDVMTMPGLPKVPSAHAIDVDDSGNIVGLF